MNNINNMNNNKRRKLNHHSLLFKNINITNNTIVNINNNTNINISNNNNINNNKRKINCFVYENSKKLKANNYCCIHEDKSICNIYECSGVPYVNRVNNVNNMMPYIT